MKNKSVNLLFVFFLMLGITNCTLSSEVTNDGKSKDDILIKITLSKLDVNEVPLAEIANTSKVKENIQFCKGLLQDIKLEQNIQVIKPLVNVQDYSDPILQPYKNMCPMLEYHKYISINPSLSSDAHIWSDEEQEKYGTEYYGTSNFSMFHIDLNNNGVLDKKEYVFHADSYFSEESLLKLRQRDPEKYQSDKWGYSAALGSDTGYFTMLDLSQCRRGYSASVHSPYYHLQEIEKNNLTAIIKHKNSYYYLDFYDLGDPPTSSNHLNLLKIDVTGKVEHVCAYKE